MTELLSNMVAVAGRLERDLARAEVRLRELEGQTERQAAALVAVADTLQVKPELNAIVAEVRACVNERNKLRTEAADLSKEVAEWRALAERATEVADDALPG